MKQTDKLPVSQRHKDASADLAHQIGMTCEEFTEGGADILVQFVARFERDTLERGVTALRKEQERLDDEDYLMDTNDCIDVIRALAPEAERHDG